MSRERSQELHAAIRGFHRYKAIWNPIEFEILSCHIEENNPHDIFAIKTCQESGRIVGHLPKELSRITMFLILRGAKVSAKLRERYYRRSPLVQGGLEVPCHIIVTLPATKKGGELLDAYCKLFNDVYTEPHPDDIVIVGRFEGLQTDRSLDCPVPSSSSSSLVSSPSLPSSKPGNKRKSKAKIATSVKSKDIRTMILNMTPSTGNLAKDSSISDTDTDSSDADSSDTDSSDSLEYMEMQQSSDDSTSDNKNDESIIIIDSD